MKLKKVYYFLIVNRDVDVYDAGDAWSDSAAYKIEGTECVKHSRYYDTIEDAYSERISNWNEKYYWCSPIMEACNRRT